ncbi:MAG: CDGSH iron-sulfur domain-containing protein [Bacteroidales bacterium]|nr:CDGSH iron-sulfur domain-containing protein [Bacteroidales bacterium]
MENNYSAEIKILENGPIQIKGEFVFRDSSGHKTTEYKEIYICRCGRSGNKPFCDNTHLKHG